MKGYRILDFVRHLLAQDHLAAIGRDGCRAALARGVVARGHAFVVGGSP